MNNQFKKNIQKKILLLAFALFIFQAEDIFAKSKNENQFYSYEKFKKSNNEQSIQYNGPKIIINGSQNKNLKNIIERLIEKNFENYAKGFDQFDINKLTLLLYETNLFNDIRIDYQNNSLTFYFEENKIIRKFEIHGNKELKDKNLVNLIEIKPGQAFDEFEFNMALKKINEFYKNIGYLNVYVEKNIKTLPGGKFIDIEINIKKGKAPKISEINFIGNKKISSEILKKESFFREKGILKIFSQKTKFNEMALKLNSENIEKFYKRQGFLDFKILNQDTIFDPRKNEIKLVLEVEEGRQYRISKIEIETKFKLTKEILKIINESKNQVFNQMKFENDIKTIKRLLSKLKINADVFLSHEDLSDGGIKIIYKIIPAQNSFIDHINISGNGRTKDSVIRNQITIHEGDLFTVDSLETSYRRISNLGFFESVNIEYKKSKDNPDMIDLFIDVEEKKTGEIHIGGGYSSVNGMFAELTLHENNIFGTGNIAGFGVQKGRNHFSLSGSYYQNNIFNTILGAGISAFYDDYKNEKLYFNNKDYGGSLSTSIPLYEDLYLKFRYLLKFNKIYNVGENASETVRKQIKNTTLSSFMYQFIYDKRDLIEYPTSGYYINFSQDFAGLGGDKHYVSSELSTRFYKTLFYLDELKSNKNAIVFQLKNNFGVVNPYNNYVLRIEDRFFLSEFRGFRQVSGISPRDHEKKPIGGDKYFFGSAQIEMPINLFQDFDIKGHVFVDYGKVLVDKEKIFSKDDLLNDSSKIFNSEKIRVSAGIGLYIITPIAPIQVAIGKPLRWESELDHRKYIYFSLNKRI